MLEKTKIKAAVWSALAVGVGTAVAGPMGLIGLVAPHIARLLWDPCTGLWLHPRR